MTNISGYSKDEIVSAASSSTSIKEFLETLGMKPNNGNYRRARYLAHAAGTELPSYDFRTATPAAIKRIRLSEEDFFSKGVYRQGPSIKNRLIKNHGWTERCMIDGCPNPNPTWNNKPLTLQVDHIDGDNLNNSMDNLRLICPNCHTQTETYSNKRGRQPQKHCVCGAAIAKKSTLCVDCYREKIKLNSEPVGVFPRERNRDRANSVRDRYKELKSIKALCEEFGLDRTTIYDILKNKSYFDPEYQAVEFVKKVTSPGDIEKVTVLRSEGNTYEQISEKTGISKSTIADICRRNS